MNAVEQWAKDKHPFIAIFAPGVAAFARDLPDIFRNAKKHQLDSNRLDIPPLRTWYGLYRNHRKYFEPFFDMLNESSELVEHMMSTGSQFIELQQRQQNDPDHPVTMDDIDQIRHLIYNLRSLSFAELRSEFEDRRLDCKTSLTFTKYFTEYKTELSFVFLVVTPCFLLYKMLPHELLRKARRGNVTAIDMLLRLDPLMLHDPAIGRCLQKIRLNGKRSAYQNLLEASWKPLKANISKSAIKSSVATLISMMAEVLNQPLTAPEIKKLFDAIAKDADKMNQDASLPQNAASLAKTIQRKRPSWEKLYTPDSKT